MSERKKLETLVGAPESDRLIGALQHGATRRDVLRILAAGGMQFAMAGTLAGVAGAAYAQTPRKGGKIRVAGDNASANDTLDPAKQSNKTDYCRGTMLYNNLVELDGTLAPRPALAESFTTTDARVWVFTLRKGVTFHDGKALSPADVVFSIMRHKDPAVASKAKTLADQIDSVKATGPNQVTVTLSAPNADLPVILGTFYFHIVKDGTTDFSKGIGTGPFKLQTFQPGVRSIVVRNPNYWKPGLPYLDEIEFVGIGDESARVNALLSGDMDLVASINPRSVARVKGSSSASVFVTQSGQYTDLIMHRDNGPGANPNFVQAMKLLLDRNLMKQSIALGYAVTGNDQPIDPTNRFYAPGLPQTQMDLDKAKFYLAKANLGSTPIPVVASPAAMYSVDMALILQQTARKVGLNLDVKRMPADGFWSNYWLTAPVGFGTVNPRPNADTLFTQFFKSDAPWNESRWKDPKFDQLLLTARAEMDVAKRKQIYADMQTMIRNDAGIGIPLFLATIDGHSNKLQGLSPIPLGGMMGYSFGEHVWLSA